MAGVRFSFIRTRSAWQDIQYHRARRAAALKEDQANMDAVNAAMANALQNKISTSSNIAANAALKRIQAAAKAKNAETTKQLDNAQRLIDQTKASLAASSTTTTSSSSSVLDTVA
jgi:beta-phosphoglucomutase-like phosphatase (HAD superfamily)